MKNFSNRMNVFSALAVTFLLFTTSVCAEQIDRRLCQALVKHTPDANVTYQPGVDAHGKPVAPADLPGSNTLQLQDSFDIPLSVSLADRLKLRHNKLSDNTDIQTGTLTVKGDQVFYNGQPLTDSQQENLAVLCLKP